jgi:organic radical activating enzyme
MNSGAVSDRVYKSKIYTLEAIHEARSTPVDQDINLRTLEIAFDRTCQYACSYCNPAFSSTWVKDIRRNGPYQQLISDGRNHFTHIHDSAQLYDYGESNPYIDSFFAWWESDLHRTLQELRITGGEPLMSGHTWKLLDWFAKNKGRSKTRLAINTNLGVNFDVLQRLLDACEGIELDLYTSNESINTHAEYIRDGLNMAQWQYNMVQLIETRRLRSLHVMCTINALCLDSLPEFLTQLLTWKSQYGENFPNFTLNILRFPSFQSPLVLPDHLRTKYKDQLQSWLNTFENHVFLHQHERNHVQRLIDYLDIVKTPHSEAFDLPTLRKDFKSFYQQYDRRRGKNFVETFPGLRDWYQSL